MDALWTAVYCCINLLVVLLDVTAVYIMLMYLQVDIRSTAVYIDTAVLNLNLVGPRGERGASLALAPVRDLLNLVPMQVQCTRTMPPWYGRTKFSAIPTGVLNLVRILIAKSG